MKKFFLSGLVNFLIFSAGFSQTVTNVGTDFWIAFPPNWELGSTLKLYISSNYSTSGTVFSDFPGVNQDFTVSPGVVTQLDLPPLVVLQAGVEAKGIHVTSNDPISLYGLNWITYTADAFLALPVNALGLDYRILSYNTDLTSRGSSFGVVATEDGTVLTVFNHQTNSTATVNIDKGQTYYVEAIIPGQDLTGSRVQSNFPVAVFGSAEITNIPPGCDAGDHIVEQMFPCYSWGKNFVTVPLAGRDGSGDIFRILAGEDGTVISVNGISGPTIDAGSFHEVNLAGNNSITTSKAVLVAQYAKGMMCTGGKIGDPLMMQIPPREQFLTNYTFCTASGFTTHWVNVVVPDYALNYIYQDGILIPISNFTPISTTNFYGAQLSIVDGSHTFTSPFPFGLFVYGWTEFNSYGYPAGTSMSPVSSISSVTISPATADGVLNVSTICFTAHVADNLSNPVPGVLVNFNISGISNITGTGYTNASGDAQYCYARTGTTPGTDNVYAEVFGFTSGTSIVTWTLPCANPSGAGTIGSSQAGCGSFVPVPLTNIILPSGYTGTLEYKWQQSTTNGISGFSDIAASNSPDYAPGTISQTTWYRRAARVDCMADWTGSVTTDPLEMTVITPQIPSVAIIADLPQICAGDIVTFTATPVNGGVNPSYQWKVNGVNQGTNNPVFGYTPLNGDNVICELTSDISCTQNNPATSNTITMIVSPVLPVSVSVSANPPGAICQGTLVTFSALPMNGGSSPLYQWTLNGNPIPGATSSTFITTTLVTGDQVRCIVTSNAACVAGNPATSSPITMVVNPNLTVSLTISANPAGPTCEGTSVTFSAFPVNGGSAPVYLWSVNGTPIPGEVSGTLTTSALAEGDHVQSAMTSNAPCALGNPANSNIITAEILPKPVVSFTLCIPVTTRDAQPFTLKEGLPLGGSFSGSAIQGDKFVPALVPAGHSTSTVTYSYTNVNHCSNSASQDVQVFPANTGFICGQPLTDIRDNQVYPTILTGTRCWMGENLNYGTWIHSSTHQTDNCIPEKYCPGDQPANCMSGAPAYQWDELIQYGMMDPPLYQGICPPGWHIPSAAEFQTLIDAYQGNSRAGVFLIDQYLIPRGFEALILGVSYLNTAWAFTSSDYLAGTFFWTSTSGSGNKIITRGVNNRKQSVSMYESSKANAFPVRCVKDF